MTQFDNSNRGAIWKNDKKETETQADFTGSINVDGVEYWLNGWRRPEGAASNTPAMKFTVKRKESRPQTAPIQQRPVARDEMESEIPF